MTVDIKANKAAEHSSDHPKKKSKKSRQAEEGKPDIEGGGVYVLLFSAEPTTAPYLPSPIAEAEKVEKKKRKKEKKLKAAESVEADNVIGVCSCRAVTEVGATTNRLPGRTS